MKDKKHNPQPLVLNEGYFTDHHYIGYDELVGCSDNWEHHCTYQLLPKGLHGRHQVLQLQSMQMAFVQRSGGMMNDVVTAKDCLTFAVIEESAGKTCFDRMKLQAGDIFFFDDSQAYNFMSNDYIELCVVNMQKENLGILKPQMTKALNHTIKDTNNVLSKTLRDILKQCTNKENKQDAKIFESIELEITKTLTKLLNEQTPVFPKLTKGEEIALKILKQIYGHMDGKISIKSFSKQYGVSEKTLQNSFKSLFGFTPNHFLCQLKLNHAHHDLLNMNSQDTTVSKTAYKWGFTHMSQFADKYTKLFGEKPSQTLKYSSFQDKRIDKSCAISQEDISIL